MRPVKKIGIGVLIISSAFLFASLILNSGITGYAVLTDVNYQIPDYVMLVAIVGITLGLLGVYLGGTIESEINQEMSMFLVNNPGASTNRLEKYIGFCISKERSDNEIKSILIESGWDRKKVDKAFKKVKSGKSRKKNSS